MAVRDEGVEDLLTLAPSLDTALRLNLALQRSFKDKVQTLETILKNSLVQQVRKMGHDRHFQSCFFLQSMVVHLQINTGLNLII